MLAALICFIECMWALTTLLTFFNNSAIKCHASLSRNRLFVAKVALIVPYVITIGTSRPYNISCKTCGGSKSVYSLMFCDDCA